jgi:phage terminase large subunit-like protein
MSLILTDKQKEALKILAEPDATNIALVGGSRSGKTLLFCYSMVVRALKSPGSRHAAVRNICRDARAKLGLDTLPTLHSLIGIKPEYDKSGGRFLYPGGSEIHLLGLDDAGDRHSRILGSSYSSLTLDECSEIPYESTLIARTRLAEKNDLVKRCYYAFNPPTKIHWLHSLFVNHVDPTDKRPLSHPENYKIFYMNPKDNASNLDPDYIKSLDDLPAKQRLRFRDGEWGSPDAGVLWRVEWIENNRVQKIIEDIDEIVIGVDPAISVCGCETGIIAAGMAPSGHIYIMSDRSSRGTPAEWAQAVVSLAKEVGASRVCVESNQGGLMVEEVLRAANPALTVELIHAGASKRVRAEPVAALAERGRIHHVGRLVELEDQLVSWSPGSESPDRLDAAVHAVAALTKTAPGRGPTVASSGSEFGIDDEKMWSSL